MYTLCFSGTHIAALDKVVYLNNRCFLPPTHPLRKAKETFPSRKAEHRPPPERLTQEEVFVNSLAYEKAKNPTQAAGFATATGSKGCYYLMLLPDHDRTEQVYPDTMHFINVTKIVRRVEKQKNNLIDLNHAGYKKTKKNPVRSLQKWV